METINYHKSDDELQWAIIALTTTLSKEQFAALPIEAEALKVECTINGHEVKLSHLVARLTDNFDQAVKTETKRQLEEHFLPCLEHMDNIRDALEEFVETTLAGVV